MWDLSCLDWEDRIRDGRSLIPDLPLNRGEADAGLQFYDELQLPDVPGQPFLRNASGQWFRDIVEAAFGSWDPVNRVRHIRDIFALAPKGSSKTSYGAAMAIVAMCMNLRPRAEALFIGPTQAISDRAYEQAAGMIDASPALKKRFLPHDHNKTIEDLVTKSEMKVKTFDVNIITGAILIFALVDEVHLLGKNAHAPKVFRQIRGGLDKTEEGVLLMTTTQSDSEPAGVFRDELKHARRIRDGEFQGKTIRPLLPVLYEFPRDIAKNPERWQNPDNWPMVMPNLNRPITLDTLIPDWETERAKGPQSVTIWASQHLNIEIGVGISNDAWAGAKYWESAADETLTLETLLARCEVITIGIDGGGLDDLLGLAILGRCKITRDWLLWNRAWCHSDLLDDRKDIATRLIDFSKESRGDLKDLVLCSDEDPTQSIRDVADICVKVRDAGLLPEKGGIGVDRMGLPGILEELMSRGFDVDMNGGTITGIPQGGHVNPAIQSVPIKLKDGTFWHAGQPLMAWCVGNAKVEMKTNARSITKQIAGSAKIDPLMATFDAVMLMSRNPEAFSPPDIGEYLAQAVMHA
jgi:phage terminase large subunit-like protein